MKRRLKSALFLGVIALVCVGAGCADKTKVEENIAKGNKIVVTYDANGGSFLALPSITIMDMFNPDLYEKDDNGEVHIKLTEPTDPSRPTSTDDTITLTYQNHFFAGWYKSKEIVTVNGVPVDWNGKALKEVNGSYYYADTLNQEKPVKAMPAYDYSGYWDFEKDTIDYSGDDVLELTLYAGWVPFYEFHYYYQKDGKWEQLSSVTSFNYKTTNSLESESDKDTIYLPKWEDGAMNYKFSYQSGAQFLFPSVKGTTFSKAYIDEDCTEEIVESFEHTGTLDVSFGEEKALVVEDRIQNIYLELEQGEQYRIEKADQLIKHANPSGYYEIYNDLDFTDLDWPVAFSTSEFTGKMYGKDGVAVTLSNINIKYASDKKYGGLFGKVSKTAYMSNVTFQDVTLDLISIGNRNHGASFGLFAGFVEEGASFKNVAINGMMRIGVISFANELAFHLLANGSIVGIAAGELHLEIYGKWLIDQYEFTVKPETVKVGKDGVISLEFYPSSGRLDKEIFVIQ